MPLGGPELAKSTYFLVHSSYTRHLRYHTYEVYHSTAVDNRGRRLFGISDPHLMIYCADLSETDDFSVLMTCPICPIYSSST